MRGIKFGSKRFKTKAHWAKIGKSVVVATSSTNDEESSKAVIDNSSHCKQN